MITTSNSKIEPFVDAGTGAEFLGITRRRLMEMARAGEIPGHPVGCGSRKTWRFRLSELAEAVATKNPATPSRKRGIINAGGPLAVVPEKRRDH